MHRGVKTVKKIYAFVNAKRQIGAVVPKNNKPLVTRKSVPQEPDVLGIDVYAIHEASFFGETLSISPVPAGQIQHGIIMDVADQRADYLRPVPLKVFLGHIKIRFRHLVSPEVAFL